MFTDATCLYESVYTLQNGDTFAKTWSHFNTSEIDFFALSVNGNTLKTYDHLVAYNYNVYLQSSVSNRRHLYEVYENSSISQASSYSLLENRLLYYFIRSINYTLPNCDIDFAVKLESSYVMDQLNKTVVLINATLEEIENMKKLFLIGTEPAFTVVTNSATNVSRCAFFMVLFQIILVFL